ncbi:MAG: hypothetical protein KME59_17090 [Trichormus sp. ATA11-4-KO1]|nr:hypothetical protein [Trichormus sp. ATA11-4-KO1]
MKGKSLTLMGTALTLALTTNVAFAQSSKSPIADSNNLSTSSPTEIKLSPEGMKILCERSPLNSRCPGGTAVISPASGSTLPETPPSESNTTPESTTAPETLMVPESDTPSSTTTPETLMVPESDTPSSTTTPETLMVPESDTSGNLTPTPKTFMVPESGTLGESISR